MIVGSQIVKVKTTELPNWLDGIIDCGYHFRIPCKVIETCCIQFSIVGRGKVMESRKVMGSFTIGPSTYTSGSGMEHWRLMMANTNSVSEIWHEVVAPETK